MDSVMLVEHGLRHVSKTWTPSCTLNSCLNSVCLFLITGNTSTVSPPKIAPAEDPWINQKKFFFYFLHETMYVRFFIFLCEVREQPFYICKKRNSILSSNFVEAKQTFLKCHTFLSCNCTIKANRIWPWDINIEQYVLEEKACKNMSVKINENRYMCKINEKKNK